MISTQNNCCAFFFTIDSYLQFTSFDLIFFWRGVTICAVSSHMQGRGVDDAYVCTFSKYVVSLSFERKRV